MAESVLALIILVAAICGQTARAAAAEELIKFESAEFLVGQIQQRLARERGDTPKVTSETIEGYLSKPDGDGPFPAVVYRHGCSGLITQNRHRVGELLTGWGYVALAVDSFATRGIKETCDHLMPARQGDALGAMLYLSKLGFVDPQRIVVMGASQGGIVALQLASDRPIKLFAIPDEPKFKAAVAFYPICGVATEQLTIPTLILIGELDNWTPAKDCERWMALRSGKG
ncbi:MAG: dienelactone hydrolase family protein, partial [Bradyrhizobium sp.]